METTGALATSQFVFKATGKMFKLVLSGIYSDKPGSITREIITNAFDAHIAAGKRDVPFVVHCPTAWEAWFSVRDYGDSMSHAFIMERFNYVGESTKDDSNQQVGGFGLGRMTPFSYTDEFMVTCIQDGHKRVYNCVLGASGTPEVNLFGEGPTEEPSGTEVRFAVGQKDVGTFRDKLFDVAAGFETPFESNISNLRWLNVEEKIGSLLVTVDRRGIGTPFSG